LLSPPEVSNIDAEGLIAGLKIPLCVNWKRITRCD